MQSRTNMLPEPAGTIEITDVVDRARMAKMVGPDSAEDELETVFVPGCSRTEIALDTLCFLFADVQYMGPLTAIYCYQDLGMSLSQTGMIMCVQYIFAVAAGPAFGGLFDKTPHKRSVLSLAFMLTAFTYITLGMLETFWELVFIFAVQSAVSGAYVPGINALGLGLVGSKNFSKRATRNEMFRHGGVLMAGLVPMLLIPRHGFHAYFYLNTILSFVGMTTVWFIDDGDIDHDMASGNTSLDADDAAAVPLKELFKSSQIRLLIGATVFFHMGNAPMLPFLGEKIETLNHQNDTHVELPGIGLIDGTVSVSLSQLMAELFSIPVAFLAGKLMERSGWGRRRVALIGFGIVPIRGLLFAMADEIEMLLVIQSLDALGAAVASVTAMVMMQDLSRGTGRFSILQGSIAASLGLGSALGQVIAGFVSDEHGFAAMFTVLSSISVIALLGITAMRETKPALLGKKELEWMPLLSTPPKEEFTTLTQM